jgi:hypothetical protein
MCFKINAFIRFTIKRPDKVRQQTLHTAYMEQVINNKDINAMFVTMKSLINFINSDWPQVLISSLFCVVAVGRT